MSLAVERISEIAAFEDLADEWRALEDDLSPRVPFTSPLWNALWWKHLRRRGAVLRDDCYIHTVRDAGRLIAVAPLMVTQTPGVGPLRYRHLQFFGTDLQITELRGPVCRPADEARALEALSRHLLGARHDWDSVRWSGLRTTAGLAHLDSGWQLRGGRITQDFYVELGSDWQRFQATRRRNVKESIRKCYNSLKRDGHAFSFHVLTRPEEVPAGLARFLELHCARAAARFERRHPNYFAADATRAFLADYLAASARRGELRLFELRIGGATVASRIAFALGRELYFYYSGYRPEWARYSVMTTLVCEALKWSIQAGITIANLSVHPEQSKLRWGPSEVAFHEYVQVATGLRHELPYSAFRAATRLRQTARRAARLVALS